MFSSITIPAQKPWRTRSCCARSSMFRSRPSCPRKSSNYWKVLPPRRGNFEIRSISKSPAKWLLSCESHPTKMERGEEINRLQKCAIAVFILGTAWLGVNAAQTAVQQEWLWYGGDAGGNRYSTMTDLDRGNVAGLKLAWEWKTGEQPIAEKNIRPGPFETTPLMIDGVLYLTTPYNKLVALDAETGRQLWVYDPKAYDEDG